MFFGGFVRMHVLYHAIREPVFGVAMMEELRRHGYEIGAGTLYPLLHQLEATGYLTSYSEVVAGRARRYYRATAAGTAALEVAKDKLRELVSEVLEDRTGRPQLESGRRQSKRQKARL
jgi:DNA-binding PadR family transcriptional regulator